MENAGVRDKVVWQEKMEQKYLSCIYKQADFFLLPTEYEIFGMVLLEAMYYGNIVLTTRNGGSSTLIEHEENGFVFEKKDALQWANTILNVTEEKRKLIQKSAEETISNGFTWDKLSEEFLNVYRKKSER